MSKKKKEPISEYAAGEGQRFRQTMENLGLTRELVAEMLGVTTETVRKYCDGEARLTCERLYQFAEFTGINTHYLVTGEKETPKTAAYILSSMTEEEANQFWNDIFEIAKNKLQLHDPDKTDKDPVP